MKNVLFIGNSYTYYNDMPKELFAKMSESVGIETDVRAVTKGGESLRGHQTEGHETYDAVSDIFEKKKYDVVVLQEQSDRPAIEPEIYLAALGALVERAKRSGAECVAYGTWPKQLGHKNLERFGISKYEMAKMLDATFQRAGEHFGIRVAYAGKCFAQIERTAGHIDVYNEDLTHPSYAGSYTAALCILNSAFGVDPETVTFNGELCANDAQLIRAAVKRVTE